MAFKDLSPYMQKLVTEKAAEQKADRERRRAMVAKIQRSLGHEPPTIPTTVEGLRAMASCPAQADKFAKRRAMVERVMRAALGA